MKNRSFEKDSFILLVLSMTGNALNYIFQILSGRSLTVVDYGSLTVLFSVMALAAVPANTMSLVVSRGITHYTLNHNRANRNNLYRIIKGICYIAVLTTVAGSIASAPITRLLNIGNNTYIIYSFIIIGISFILAIVIGVLQGTKRFLALGFLSMALPMVKMVSLIPVLLAGSDGKIRLILQLTAAGNCMLTIACFIIMRKHISHPTIQDDITLHDIDSPPQENQVAGFALVAAIASLGMAFVSNMDIFFIKKYFSGIDSGLYSSAMIFGKVILYIPNALIFVMFPMITEAGIRKTGTRKLLLKTIIYTLGVTTIAFLVFALADDWFMSFLYGERYMGATQYVKLSMLNVIPISLLVILTNYFLATYKVRFFIPSLLSGLLISSIWIIVDHSSIERILIQLFIVNTAVFMINLIHLFIRERSHLAVSERTRG